MRVRAYDWVVPQRPRLTLGCSAEAELKLDTVLRAVDSPSPLVLFPEHGELSMRAAMLYPPACFLHL